MKYEIKKLEAIGGKRWTKNGMDRIYISSDVYMGLEYDEHKMYAYFNRHQRMNMKVYYDINKEELVITLGSDEAKEALTAALDKLINDVK